VTYDPDREHIRAELELHQFKLDQAREAWQAQLDALRSDSSARYADELRAHQDRVRAMEEQQTAWLRGLYAEDGDTNELAQRESSGASDGEPATPSAVPAGQPHHAAAQLSADEIRAMDMQDFAALRQRMGMGNGSGRGLFG
jgi:hypothetical protein